MKKQTVFFDFDNTITTFDVLDDIIQKFSKDEKWMELEEQWKKGEIGSRQCLYGQIKGVRITKDSLDEYLQDIEIDSYFKPLISFLNGKNIKWLILSDNFDYILKKILVNNGIKNTLVFSNKISFSGDKLIPSFPHTDKKCRSCAHCKKSNLFKNAAGNRMTIYIGDGRSDVCPSKYANIVFAKDSLLRYYKENKKAPIPYKGLKDVHAFLKDIL